MSKAPQGIDEPPKRGHLPWLAILMLVAALLSCNLPGGGGAEVGPATELQGGDFGTEEPSTVEPPPPTATGEPNFDLRGQAAEEPAYRYLARMTTTSNWTRVLFQDADAAAVSHQIVAGEELEVRRLPELRTIYEGGDSVGEATVEYDLYLRDIPETGLRVRIGKGHRGRTELVLYGGGGESSAPIRTLAFDGVGDTSGEFNQRWFDLSRSAITAGDPVPLPDTEYEKQLLAFYYPWYGSPDGPTGEARAWDTRQPPHMPPGGYYDSMEESTFLSHIEQARRAGIDGFILSWWGIDSFTDRAIRQVILPVAEREGFPVTVYVEQANSRDQLVADLRYLIEDLGASSAFMRADGSPVIFIYDRVTRGLGGDSWGAVFDELESEGLDCFCQADGLSAAFHQGDTQFDYLFDHFDGVHLYSPGGLPFDMMGDIYNANALKADVLGTTFAATVMPGFDNSLWYEEEGFDRLVIDRRGGQHYRETWELAVASDPDWILITSFNEWMEGTEIEVSQELGDQYLELTRELVDAWKGDGGM